MRIEKYKSRVFSVNKIRGFPPNEKNDKYFRGRYETQQKVRNIEDKVKRDWILEAKRIVKASYISGNLTGKVYSCHEKRHLKWKYNGDVKTVTKLFKKKMFIVLPQIKKK